DLNEKAFGGSVEITMKDGTVITDDIAVADAHPLGARPFGREQYINKFSSLAEGVIEEDEIDRFLDAVQRLDELQAGERDQVNVMTNSIPAEAPKGLF